MMPADERAVDLLRRLRHTSGDVAIAMIVRTMKEYARDQRHACAEAVSAHGVAQDRVSLDPVAAHANAYIAAHAAVMNTPFPGEGRHG